jgi:hypothetical protein
VNSNVFIPSSSGLISNTARTAVGSLSERQGSRVETELLPDSVVGNLLVGSSSGNP